MAAQNNRCSSWRYTIESTPEIRRALDALWAAGDLRYIVVCDVEDNLKVYAAGWFQLVNDDTKKGALDTFCSMIRPPGVRVKAHTALKLSMVTDCDYLDAFFRTDNRFSPSDSHGAFWRTGTHSLDQDCWLIPKPERIDDSW